VKLTLLLALMRLQGTVLLHAITIHLVILSAIVLLHAIMYSFAI
jgi:hypothetical protein